MTADELRLVLETELAWRQEELAFFKNQLNEIVEEDKDKYRKSLVLILYSHMEGYIKICLQTYIQYINSQGLKRKEVDTGLMVASMHKEFIAYENTERKSEFFRKELPDDTRLHRLYRRVDFMEKVEDFKEQELIIDDQIIDNIVGYVRQTGIDAVKYEAWIMELIQKQGGKITRDNVVELLNVTPPQAYRLLKKMSDKGRIKLVGNGRSAYYELVK